eukprot:scaffold67160_cov28-Tisochrysis_lutea.AAC.1
MTPSSERSRLATKIPQLDGVPMACYVLPSRHDNGMILVVVEIILSRHGLLPTYSTPLSTKGRGTGGREKEGSPNKRDASV